MNFKEIYIDVTTRLANYLPEYYTYHSVKHTVYVVEKAEYIARKEGVSEDDIFLLKVAALYHDIGFLKGPLDHEKVGCEIANAELPMKGFSEEEVRKICGMIMATKIPQNPNDLLEEILADADLEYLGTANYEVVSNYLFSELKHFNENLTQEDWESIQINFLKSHQFHTAFCKRYKEHRKRINLEKLSTEV